MLANYQVPSTMKFLLVTHNTGNPHHEFSWSGHYVMACWVYVLDAEYRKSWLDTLVVSCLACQKQSWNKCSVWMRVADCTVSFLCKRISRGYVVWLCYLSFSICLVCFLLDIIHVVLFRYIYIKAPTERRNWTELIRFSFWWTGQWASSASSLVIGWHICNYSHAVHYRL